jgi:hypothetical protein
LKKKIVQIRGLSLKHDVSLSKARGPLPNGILQEEYEVEKVDRLARVYKRLGFLAESTDFAKALVDYSRFERTAAYDSRTTSIVVAPEASRLGRALAGDTGGHFREIPIAFALTQALQAQHFNWQEKLVTASLENRRLAMRALAKGDAVLMGLNYSYQGTQFAKRQEHAQAIGRLAAELEKLGSELPELLRQKWVFPYRQGSQFVWWAYAAQGWNGVNALFADPPVSTSQILHPEKYYLQRQEPVAIIPWGLIRQLKAAPVIEQTFGEALVQVPLVSRYSRKESEQIASGWSDDRLLVYAEGDRLITVWLSAWSNNQSATRFFRAYQNVLQSHYRARFRTLAGRDGSLHLENPAGDAVVLQHRGSVVLLLDGTSLPRALDLAEAIWNDLEVGTEPIVMPLDSAQRRLQPPRRSR